MTYWDELTRVFDWTQTHVHSTFGVCWAAWPWPGISTGWRKHALDRARPSAASATATLPRQPYLRGFSDDVLVPVSRWTEVRQPEVDASPGLKTLIASDQVGPCLIEDAGHRALYVFNHFEYDSTTLEGRIRPRRGMPERPSTCPENYYPDDDPAQVPTNRWRSHAHLLYGNWINEIYQTTPFDPARIWG